MWHSKVFLWHNTHILGTNLGLIPKDVKCTESYYVVKTLRSLLMPWAWRKTENTWGWLHVQFGQNCNKRIAFCRRHCFAPLFAACLTARRVKVGFVHSHDCRACTNPTGVVWLQSDGE